MIEWPYLVMGVDLQASGLSGVSACRGRIQAKACGAGQVNEQGQVQLN